MVNEGLFLFAIIRINLNFILLVYLMAIKKPTNTYARKYKGNIIPSIKRSIKPPTVSKNFIIDKRKGYLRLFQIIPDLFSYSRGWESEGNPRTS